MSGTHPHHEQVRRYLDEALGTRAPREVRHVADFAEQPLPDEGPASLFAFELTSPAAAEPCDPNPQRHFVAGGRTEPNYFPAYHLTPDEAYSFHIGTRFMLYMGVQKVAEDLEPPTARAALGELVANLARGAKLTDARLAALFRCEDDYFAVYRLQLDDQPVYCLGADCPPGFYHLTDYPPQMVLRLHLGNVLREEARQAAARSGD